jgi:hypothetical protein
MKSILWSHKANLIFHQLFKGEVKTWRKFKLAYDIAVIIECAA